MKASVRGKQVAGMGLRGVALAFMVGLAACGGGSDDTPTASALQGTAAIGSPVAGGTVQVRCAGGVVLQGPTAADGSWRIDTTGQALPCGVRVSGGSLAASEAFHTVALSFGTVNITPLTDLITANLLGQAPALWWGESGPTAFSGVTEPAATQALSRLRAALALPALQNVDPRTIAFRAVAGDVVDDVLEALQQALRSAETSYSGLLAAATGNAFALSDGFRAGLNNAYAQVRAGTGAGTGGGTGAGGNYTLVMDVSVAGAGGASISIPGVPKPSSQSEFCGAVSDSSSGIGIQQALQGGTGTLTINSCTFDGSVGRVAATMAITSPIAMNVSYAVVYTYR